MMTDKEELIILSEHLQAVGRERDWLQSEVNRLTDELHLAHEALKREFVHQGIIKAVAE